MTKSDGILVELRFPDTTVYDIIQPQSVIRFRVGTFQKSYSDFQKRVARTRVVISYRSELVHGAAHAVMPEWIISLEPFVRIDIPSAFDCTENSGPVEERAPIISGVTVRDTQLHLDFGRIQFYEHLETICGYHLSVLNGGTGIPMILERLDSV